MQEKINFSDYSQIPDDLKQKMQQEDAEKTELILALDKKVQLLQKSNDLQKVIIDSYEAEKKRASIGSLIGTGIAGSVLTGLALKAKDADASVDGNANVSSKDIRTLMNEMPKPHRKLLAYNKIYYEINKKYGFKTANEWLEAEWTKGQLIKAH